MKNNYNRDMKLSKLIGILTLALLAALPANAKSRAREKGQLHVSRVEVFSQENKVHLAMRVAYSNDLLNRGEKLYVSPRLAKGDDSCLFSSMVFDGRSRKVLVREKEVIVVADEAHGQFYFDIEFTSTYQPWMQDISLRFLSEEVVKNSVRNAYIDTLYEGMLVPEKQ